VSVNPLLNSIFLYSIGCNYAERGFPTCPPQACRKYWQHALNHRNWAIYAENCHATSFVPGATLARLYPGVSVVKTNSIHHQAIRQLGRDLVVEAWSEPDRIVEAIRHKGPGYVFAVQWHPEFHAPDDPSFLDDTPILDDFLAAAAQHKDAAFAV
jgi:putative glutamine amidotransferase